MYRTLSRVVPRYLSRATVQQRFLGTFQWSILVFWMELLTLLALSGGGSLIDTTRRSR